MQYVELEWILPDVVTIRPIQGNELSAIEVKCPYDSLRKVLDNQMVVVSREKSHFHSKEAFQGFVFI